MKQNKTKLPIKLNILIFGLIEELNLMKTENKDAVKNFCQTQIKLKKIEIILFYLSKKCRQLYNNKR